MTTLVYIVTILGLMSGEVQTNVGDAFRTLEECLTVATIAANKMEGHPEVANVTLICVEVPVTEI